MMHLGHYVDILVTNVMINFQQRLVMQINEKGGVKLKERKK